MRIGCNRLRRVALLRRRSSAAIVATDAAPACASNPAANHPVADPNRIEPQSPARAMGATPSAAHGAGALATDRTHAIDRAHAIADFASCLDHRRQCFSSACDRDGFGVGRSGLLAAPVLWLRRDMPTPLLRAFKRQRTTVAAGREHQEPQL